MKSSTIVKSIAQSPNGAGHPVARPEPPLLRSGAAGEPSLWEVQKILSSKRFVDLTHAFEPGIPHWEDFPDEKREPLSWHGFTVENFTHVGQWGTHIDAPAHLSRFLQTIDQIVLKEMILPLVVIDVHAEAAKNPDYTLWLDRIKRWESEHGPIPPGAFVALRTDWSKRWPDHAAMQNKDAKGVSHYPGWSLPALEYLYEERKITASGHETANTDPGIAVSKDDYSLERYILGRNHYQIELLTNLDQVPEAGALAVVTFPKPKRGSGFPARVFAILPDSKDSNQEWARRDTNGMSDIEGEAATGSGERGGSQASFNTNDSADLLWGAHAPSRVGDDALVIASLSSERVAARAPQSARGARALPGEHQLIRVIRGSKLFRLVSISAHSWLKRCLIPVRRFSVKVFLLVTLLHIFGTILLMDAHFTLKQAMQTGQPEGSFLWLYVLSWIWHPVPRLLSPYLGPLAPSSVLHYTFAWSLCVGACFGFLVPRLSRWRRRTA